jgi:hypothetical protein
MILPLLSLALLVASLQQAEAQPQAPHADQPALRTESRATLRAIDDVQAACRHLLATDHSYTGSVTVAMVLGEPGPDTTEAIPYRGSRRGSLNLLHLGTFTVLQNGDHQIERKGEGAQNEGAQNEGTWTEPQGEAPDCPMSPTSLAAHMPTATITTPTATSHADRPAMRVHAEWQGEAAAALLSELAMPRAGWQPLLERLPSIARKHGDRLCVDASIVYDPATKKVYAATLRLALLGPQAPPEDMESEAPPAGLPPLPKELLAELRFCVTVQPLEAVPMPELDETLRSRLALPAR